MTKLATSVTVDQAVKYGMDISKVGLTPVYVYNMDGYKTVLAIGNGGVVHVTAGRTCLIVNGHPCVAVETAARVRVCASRRPSLGMVSLVGIGQYVFDRKVTRLSWLTTFEQAVEKAVEAHAACSGIAERLRALKESRKAHPVIAARARKACEDEMRGRAASRKAGRDEARRRARERDDARTLTAVRDYMRGTAMLRRKALPSGWTAEWNTAEYDKLDRAATGKTRSLCAAWAVNHDRGASCVYRFEARGKRVYEVVQVKDTGLPPFDGDFVTMATEQGAERLADRLNNVRLV